MRFNGHSALTGMHAFLSASKHHWVNYDNEKFDRTYFAREAAMRGTRLHDLARDLIREGIGLPKTQQTMNLYVNDGIGFRMQPEIILFYSNNAFGTADTISFRNGTLRISDLKTGVTPTSMRQLEIYAAYFCLEYNYRPEDITIELRIYQNDEVKLYSPDQMDIQIIMDKVIALDKRIQSLREDDM